MPGTASETEGSSRARGSSGVTQKLSGAFISLILLVLVAALLEVWDARQGAIREYEGRQTRLGVVIAEQTARDMQAVDTMLAATAGFNRACGQYVSVLALRRQRSEFGVSDQTVMRANWRTSARRA